MKLQVYKQDNGLWTVIARKTRPYEGRTQSAHDIPQEKYEETVKSLVDAVKNPAPAG